MGLRRRSPQWVRDLTFKEVHGIAHRLRTLSTTQDLSERQEWLWDALLAELTWRNQNEPRWLYRCTCELCIGPFDPDTYAEELPF